MERLARVEITSEKTERQVFRREVGMKSCRDDLKEEAASNIRTLAAVYGGYDESGELVNGTSGSGYEELREVSLVEIVVLIVVILVAKRSQRRCCTAAGFLHLILSHHDRRNGGVP